jgi:hypothetical protein
MAKKAKPTVTASVPPQTPPRHFPAYYDHRAGHYLLDATHGWTQLGKEDLMQHLRLAGWCDERRNNTKHLSSLDYELIRIQTENKIDYAGPVAGYRKGLYTMGGSRVLVTRAFAPITPTANPTPFPLIEQIIHNLLARIDPLQRDILYSWLHVYLRCLATGYFMPGQIIFLIGPHDCGKSFLQQNIITPLFGGRSANPWPYMSGATEFNSELFGAEHLQIEDPPVNRISDRLDFSARIKQLTVNEIQPCHGKNRDIVTIQPHWRVSGSINDEPYNVRAVPPIDDSTADKIDIFKCAANSIPCTSNLIEEREKFRLAVLSELPAFAHFLLHTWAIPEVLKSGRFGVTHYHHADLLAEINSNSPEFDLLTTIDAIGIFEKGKGCWVGTVKQLATLLCDCFNDNEARRLGQSERSLALKLASLARKYSQRVQFKKSNGKRLWIIYKSELSDGSDGPA